MAKRKDNIKYETDTEQKSRRKRSAARRPGGEVLIRVDGQIKEQENRYYRKVSDVYRACGFIMILVLAVFCCIMLVRYSEYITYDNFVYLIRDIGSVSSDETVKYSTVKYTSGENTVFESFGGGLALIDTDSVTVYDRSGVEVCSEFESFSYPAAAKSDKYLIVYDIGGDGFSIYNSITRVATRKAEGTIIAASVSDEGSFIVVTESNEAKYRVQLYSSSLGKVKHILKDSYVTDAAISRDGKYIVTASVTDGNSGFGGEISFFLPTSTEQAEKTYSYPMSLPILAEGTGDGFTVIFDDSVRFYTSDGELKSETYVGTSGVSYGDIGTSSTVVVCPANSVGSENRVYVFDGDGNIILDSLVRLRVTGASAAVEGSRFSGFLTSAEGVHALNLDGTYETDGAGVKILAVTDTDGGTLVCTPTESYPLFENEEENQ